MQTNNPKQVYIEYREGQPSGIDFYVAKCGFEWLGSKIIPVTSEDIDSGKYCEMYNKYPFIVSIDSMVKIFTYLAVDIPTMEVEPTSKSSSSILSKEVIQRDVYTALLGNTLDYLEGCYIKPRDYKRWTSFLYDGTDSDKKIVEQLYSEHGNIPIIAQEPIFGGISSEWRAYIRNRSNLVDIRPYSGNPYAYKVPKISFIQKAVNLMHTRPHYEVGSNFVLDIAITHQGDEVLIEPGDFWSIGSYGLDHTTYAEMLSERYHELFITK